MVAIDQTRGKAAHGEEHNRRHGGNQGGAWLAVKTDGAVAARARSAAMVAAVATLVLFAVGGFATSLIDGYRFVVPAVTDGASNPLAKEVAREPGFWLTNYTLMPWMMIAPALGFLGASTAALLLWRGRPGLAFIGSSFAVFGIIATAGVSMFPFLLPSSSVPNHSLTVWDASSSQNTLWVMLIAAVILVPIILAYTAWVYRVMWGKVTDAQVKGNDASY